MFKAVALRNNPNLSFWRLLKRQRTSSLWGLRQMRRIQFWKIIVSLKWNSWKEFGISDYPIRDSYLSPLILRLTSKSKRKLVEIVLKLTAKRVRVQFRSTCPQWVTSMAGVRSPNTVRKNLTSESQKSKRNQVKVKNQWPVEPTGEPIHKIWDATHH